MLSGGLTHSLNPTNPRRGKPEMRRCPGFCPYYPPPNNSLTLHIVPGILPPFCSPID